jgi:hypothetical protein
VIYWTLALRHLFVRPGRAFMLLLGYGLGVAVMIVLLSIGEAMLDQSRDVSLVGGGELTALPQGIDTEALRNGALAGMFFGINGARFVSRAMLGGPRHARLVASTSPVLEQKALMMSRGDRSWPVRAGGEIPGAARAAGASLRVLSGAWRDNVQDLAWLTPDAQTMYDEIDRFHRPPGGDSAWAEWHYFNLVVSEREWWYITLLVGGDIRTDAWGGQVLVTHRTATGAYRRFMATVSRDAVQFDTARANITIGASSVIQRKGTYHVRGASGAALFDFDVHPLPGRYFPAVDVGAEREASGYAVAVLAGTATGHVCDGARCTELQEVPAYHDHNWGTWRAVTWEWGAGRSASGAILYGGVLSASRATSSVPFFLGLEDSLGLRQVYRFQSVERFGTRPLAGFAGVLAPDSLRIVAARLDDTLRVLVRITDVTGSESRSAGPGLVFLQMRGAWSARGTAAGAAVSDSGRGFFETWTRGARR